MKKVISKNVLNSIKDELLELGFDVDSIGIVYWIDAIKQVNANPLEWSMISIYENVAKKRKTTKGAVERLMRFTMAPAKENIQKKYGYYNAIKNQTFLNLIRFN